ncbi:MAG: iron-sulfur cluster assembly scaffold protein [Candidatus Tectimicrobiota bacterium]|nr:MAG: iron-sulfur cluster assembly scaffold protein [Candidatus Tectomicrobia bacterium]
MSYNLYQENILDHYENPHCRGRLDNPTLEYRDYNPLCGDEVCVQARLDAQGRLAEVRFDGKGCVISMAAASMLMEEIEGKPLQEVKKLGREEMLRLIGIPLTTMRVKCAMLPLRALEKAICLYEGRQVEAERNGE